MSTPPLRALRIATRASKLARFQADWAAARLRTTGREVEIVELATAGDQHPLGAIADIGAPGVFTKEIQRAVLAGDCDLAVHSLKDLPTEMVAGLTLSAVPLRENPADALVSRSGLTLQALPSAARIGTGSLRRQAQLRHARPDLVVESIRGNVETRLGKLDTGQYDAIVLAVAGLRRLNLAERMTQELPSDVMLPAVGQGALAIECRSDDAEVCAALAELDSPESHAAVLAERALLAHLRGGCLAPIGALGCIERGKLQLSAVVLDADGTRRLAASEAAPPADAESLGRRVAQTLIAQGAAELIAATRP